ncbi:hypothetical protein A6R68_09157 [Neotoma lepida]|uniref:Uncharacterized protein n=1 Tax=Neotoma lepida TaxID=56216 RepID=A0A1A6G1K2_NEOLE|nr:hypothetical protein A6R68_09157 [Neotoma lepida]
MNLAAAKTESMTSGLEERLGCSRSRSHRAGLLGGKRGVLAPASLSPTECRVPPSAPLPIRQAGRTREPKQGALLPRRKGPRPPSCTRPPAPRLTGPWPVPGGAAGREAAALQPVMLGPGTAPPGLPRAPGSRRQLRLALPGGRPTRAEVAEKEARASAGWTDRHAGQWEAGSWRGAWLRLGSAPGWVPLGCTFLRRVPGC